MCVNYATVFSSSVFYSWLVYKDWLDYKEPTIAGNSNKLSKHEGKTAAGIREVRAPVSPPVSPHTLSFPLTILGPEGPPWGLLFGLAGHCKVPCAGAGGWSCSCKRVLMPYSHHQGHASLLQEVMAWHEITKDIQTEERDRQSEVAFPLPSGALVSSWPHWAAQVKRKDTSRHSPSLFLATWREIMIWYLK